MMKKHLKNWKKLLSVAVLGCMLATLWLPVKAATPINLALNKAVTTSNNESPTTVGAKAVDGNTDTYWGTEQNKANGEWIEVDLGGVQTVRQINLLFERKTASQNILEYKVELKENGSYTEVFRQATKAKQEEIIRLDADHQASNIKVTIIKADGGSLNWVNVGIREIMVYSAAVDPSATLDGVTSSLIGGTIAKDVATFPMPTVPSGFSLSLNGADFEQIIAKDGAMVHPLTDKTVKVSFVVTDTTSGQTKKTSDLDFLVKGKYDPVTSANAKPIIIPEIAEWYATDTQKLSAQAITLVRYEDSALASAVDEFIQDYRAFTGRTLTKEQGGEKAGAFNFSLSTQDVLLGKEGYASNIKSDRIATQSKTVTGTVFAMQTILQMVKQNSNEFSVGEIRDYPRYAVRGFLIDAARKPISMSMLKEMARTMRYYKMNDLQVHLSDNYIWLEDYGVGATENESFKAYEAFRLETSLKNAKGETPTAKDYAFSKREFKSFILDQRSLGMQIVPEIDVPAHATSFTKIWPEVMVKNETSSLNRKRPLVDHFDLTKPETTAKIKEIFDDYTTGADPTFDKDTVVHIGADEFLYSYKSYRNFFNEFVPYIKKTNPVRVWGGLTWIKDNPETQIAPEAIKDVQMNLWASSWADGMEMYKMGFGLINTIDDHSYLVPDGSLKRANTYGDLLDLNRVFNSYAPNMVGTRSGYQAIPSGDPQMLGAAYALWNDMIDKRASGLTESDLYWRFFDALPLYAEKTWATTGKEKGTVNALTTLAQTMGTGPNTNPYYQAAKSGDNYTAYDFANNLTDSSGNNRNLSIEAGNSAVVKNGALSLNGASSFATSPLAKLGNGNQLSFDIEIPKAYAPGQIIFEADAPYATHDLRIMSDGKLGFTRELYEYSFDYVLPVAKKTNVRIAVSQQKAQLFIDNKFVSDASGQFIDRGLTKKTNISNATLALPLQRIGSKTNAIVANIDNIVTSNQAEASDPYEKDKWTGTTNSETINNESEGKLIYAFDKKTDTIWHSNWKGATDKLTGSNSYWAEINFGKAYSLNQFSFTPRQDADSGQVTKADLYIKEKATDPWVKVATDQAFTADKKKKTFNFAAQMVQFIKFEAKASNDGWVAVSELDLGKAETQKCQIYVEASQGGTAEIVGAKEVDPNTEVTVRAKLDAGYKFAGWYSFGKKLSEDMNYKFRVAYNTVLQAKFEAVAPTPTPTPTEPAPFNIIKKFDIPSADVTVPNNAFLSNGDVTVRIYRPEGAEPWLDLIASQGVADHEIYMIEFTQNGQPVNPQPGVKIGIKLPITKTKSFKQLLHLQAIGDGYEVENANVVATVSADKEFVTFDYDKFSPFIVSYVDSTMPITPTNPAEPVNPVTPKPDLPKTGERGMNYLALLFLLAIVPVSFYLRKRAA